MRTPADLRQIEAFLALCDELHFGRAAQRIGTTTSRVSQVIRDLERAVGGQLFERTSRRVVMTPLGERLRADLEPAYEQLRNAFAAGRAAAGGVAGTLRLGMFSPISGGAHLLEITRAFEAAYPTCRVELVDTGHVRYVGDWLQEGEIDLMATRLPVSDPDLVIGPVMSREPRVLAVAEHHALAARSSVSVDDLAGYAINDWHVVPREMMDAFIPPRTSSGEPLRRVSHQTFTDVAMRVAKGEMVHPTVPSFLDYYGYPGITSVPIRDLPPSETALIWRARAEGMLVPAFVRTARRVLMNHRSDVHALHDEAQEFGTTDR